MPALLPCRVATSENDRLHIYSLCNSFEYQHFDPQIALTNVLSSCSISQRNLKEILA